MARLKGFTLNRSRMSHKWDERGEKLGSLQFAFMVLSIKLLVSSDNEQKNVKKMFAE